MKSVLALFSDVASVNAAIDMLRSQGYTDDVISVVTKKDTIATNEFNIDHDSMHGIKEGAKMGGAIGGILGLLAGIGAITIPGLGVLLISGPLATALGLTGVAGATATGALTGALAGGLVATLKELGIDETQAKMYEERVKSGAILLGVAVEDNQVSDIENALKESGADDVKAFDLKPLSVEDESLEEAEAEAELEEENDDKLYGDATNKSQPNTKSSGV